MKTMTKKSSAALAIAALGACLVGGNAVLAQTKQLKAPASAPQIVNQSQNNAQSSSSIVLNAPEGSSSYSVVIENHTTPDGKVVQSKKVWSNGSLVEEEEKEIDAADANNGLNATIQLPNGQITPGGIFQSEDDQDVFGGFFSGSASPMDAIRQMEEQMRVQQERMRAQFEALRNQLSNGQGAVVIPNDEDFQKMNVMPQNPVAPSKYWLGMTISAVPEILVSQLPIENNEGVLVNYVVPDSPAGKLGLKIFDVVRSINGQVVSNPQEVTTLVEKLGAQKVKIEYFRKGKLETGEIEIVERPQTLNAQLNLNAPLRNKKFQVVRPGLIVPSDGLDVNANAAVEAEKATEESNEAAAETPAAEASAQENKAE